jgi:hypothetical protein
MSRPQRRLARYNPAINLSNNRRRRIDRANLLAAINVGNIFPPFIYNPRRLRTLLARARRRPRRRDYNGFDLCVVVVSEEARIVNGVTDFYVVRSAANSLWRSTQKSDYIQLINRL